MNLQKEILIRYRGDGHVRFELPEVLCAGSLADRLEAGLKRIEGVYRVDLYRRQRKLSVRFDSVTVDFYALAQELNAIVKKLEAEGIEAASCPACQKPSPMQNWRKELSEGGLARWMRSKYEEITETITAAGILLRAQKRKPAPFLPSANTAMDFFTDLLVLYLIKTHWQMIFHSWIRRPLQYKSEWMATFYMIFLLMRSRMPKTQ